MKSRTSSPLNAEDIDEQRKIALFKWITIFGICVLIPIGILSIINGHILVGVLDFSFTGFLGVLLYFTFKNKYFAQVSQLGVLVSGLFFFYLFMNQSAGNTGHLWSLVYPLFSFFILGYRRGMVASFLLLLAVVLYLVFQNHLSLGFEPYPSDFSVRLVPAYLLIVVYAYIFEKARETAMEQLSSKNKEMEQIVNELKIKDDELRATHKTLEGRITEIKKAEKEIRYLAFYDGLTGLANRMLFMDRLDQVIIDSKRQNKHFALLFLDLDNFKRINDTLGHHIGDSLLKKVAASIKNSIRSSDLATAMNEPKEDENSMIARLGGDEFTILATELSTPESAAIIARRLLEGLSKANHIDGHDLSVTTSIGISVFPNDGTKADVLLKNADTAMYHAKDEGKNTYQFFTGAMNQAVNEKFYIDRDLRPALQRDELILYYQPKVDMKTRKIVGAEALIRWQHPNRGMIPPDKFIPIAEETNLIIDINKWVASQACRQADEWKKSYKDPIKVALNLSGYRLANQNIIDTLEAILDETQLDPQTIEIEITENILMHDTEEIVTILNRIKSLNLSIAMDDFGTGYSSLSYLMTFPLDTIKIDRSFVMDCTANKYNLVIIKAIIAMGQSLGKKIIAEGVETEHQYNLLNELGCHEAQGYFFKHPVPVEEFNTLLKDGGYL